MRKYLLIFLTALCVLSSCKNTDEPDSGETDARKTLLMYLPWSDNLTSYFKQNIKDMEACIADRGGLGNERVLVFMCTSATVASLFEIKYENGECNRVELKTYVDPAFTTEEGIAGIIGDAVAYAPADKYAMIIGCHGMGWLPVSSRRGMQSREKPHWECGPDALLTRYFGGISSNHQTDVWTLAAAIADNGLKMEYILFDDCYMASIEVAYELKEVADYLIASTCEVMAYGMPYATMGRHLLGTPDYKAVCDDFHEFYSNYTAMPCGTLSVTDLSQLDAMADLMRQINKSYSFDGSDRRQLQVLDGYNPTIFYDFGDYVNTLLRQNDAPAGMAAEFELLLNRLVPYKTNTEKFYTAAQGPLKINRYSGITTSDPSVSSTTAGKVDTRWYHATH
ncbi:MAG: Clostripain family protein [Muribaculaceae bacterium]|nr:Clostripain family protein [Muribaculaceae bacterium]